jgi:uncharacterized protein with FMN-binding domain
MNRSPIVLAGTAVGLVGVLAYNTSSSPSAVVGSSSASTTADATSTAASSTTPTTAPSSTASGSTTSAPTRRRSATGQDVSFQYGDLQVKVTKSGARITDISLVQANVSDSHSQSIDQVAIPQLRQEAMSAQSAKIDGVSGASYTSEAYAQSLQSALDRLP